MPIIWNAPQLDQDSKKMDSFLVCSECGGGYTSYGPKAAGREKSALRVTKQASLRESSWPNGLPQQLALLDYWITIWREYSQQFTYYFFEFPTFKVFFGHFLNFGFSGLFPKFQKYFSALKNGPRKVKIAVNTLAIQLSNNPKGQVARASRLARTILGVRAVL